MLRRSKQNVVVPMTPSRRPDRWPRALRLVSAGLAGLALGLVPGLAAPAFSGRFEALPALGLSSDGTTVSGLSSGDDIAGQFHLAFSASLAGAAVMAAGPDGFSRGSLATAMYQCSCPANPSAPQRWQNQVPGAGCSVLAPSVLASLADSALDANRRHARVPGAAHGLPVPGGPVACDRTATPYPIRCPCDDAAGQLLAGLYGATPGALLQPALAPAAAHLRRFNQLP